MKSETSTPYGQLPLPLEGVPAIDDPMDVEPFTMPEDVNALQALVMTLRRESAINGIRYRRTAAELEEVRVARDGELRRREMRELRSQTPNPHDDLLAFQHARNERLMNDAFELDLARIKEVEAATTDPLTGLGNRRRLQEFFSYVVNDTLVPNSLLMIDLDHFKQVNDTHGHDVGDEVLCATARLLEGSVRESDAVFRIGGEELVVLLSGTNETAAAMVAEKIRTNIEKGVAERTGLPLTASIGVAEINPDADLLKNLKEADKAVYQAKHNGRNTVVLASSIDQ